MNKFVICILLILISLIAMARTYKLDGMIGGKYPIVIELEEDDRGLFYGRYAYKSTLKKNGEGECSWLDINPNYENPATQWDVRDCNLNPIEKWYNIRFTNCKKLTATMKNNSGKTYTVSANVVSTPSASASLTQLFKQHIGEYVSDFGMFRNQQVYNRLRKLMPNGNYDLMRNFYQVETPIEYTKGMYWGSGFMAHQCCDPAVLWAYDADNNAFYVWVRKDDRDYWWSETGSIPYKFRELVNNKF